MYDLAVIGAGPAGCAAAITAAGQGASVVLFEKGDFPRQRVCGEFVSAESLTLLSRLLNATHRPILDNAVRIRDAQIFLDGRIIRAKIDPGAASIARFNLDAALWQSAQEAGADARVKTLVSKVDGNSPFEVHCGGATIRARAMIHANGRWSNLNQSRETSKNKAVKEKWIGIKAHYEEHSPPSSVDLYFFEGGYCGVQPVNLADTASRRVNVSAMVRASVATTLPQVFRRNAALEQRSTSWQPLTDVVTTFPLLFRGPECTAGNNILRVGDAAGFVDPFVGDGISLALRSGAMAAESLRPFFTGKAKIEESVAKYRASYEANLAAIFRNSSQLRRLLHLPRLLRRPLLYVLSKTPPLTEWMMRRTR
jgi:flavin-dependent dehydrogenase